MSRMGAIEKLRKLHGLPRCLEAARSSGAGL
jgi:hypothetical protein